MLEGSDLVLEEITQEIEASVVSCLIFFCTIGLSRFDFYILHFFFQTELDRKSNDKVCVNDSSIKKVKNLINLETRNTQDTPKTVEYPFICFRFYFFQTSCASAFRLTES